MTDWIASATETSVASGAARLATYELRPAAGAHAPSPPLVFLHAGVADARMWRGAFAEFGRERRVVAYDRRGFGHTAAVDEEFDPVADLAAVLDHLGIDRAVLVGCSQGGRIALDFTVAEPARVDRLVLVAAAIGGAPQEPSDDPRMADLEARMAKIEEGGDPDALNRLEAHIWLDGPYVDEGRVRGAARDLFLEMNGITLAAPAVGRPRPRDDAWASLESIATATRVMWGTLDFPDDIALWRRVAARIPGATTHVFEGIAHLPSLEAPELFNRALRAFV